LIDQQIDPAVEIKKRRDAAAQRITFDTLRTEFLKHFEQKKKHGEASRILHREFKAWEGRFADEITAEDVDDAIQLIVRRNARYQAINTFGYVRSMYSWAMGVPRMRIKSSPCEGLKTERLIGKKQKRRRVLNDAELRAIWNACDDDRCVYPYGQIAKLLILTAVREAEIGRLSWPEIDNLDDAKSALLIVPSERVKGEDDDPPPPHEVPLTRQMVDIISSMPRLSGPFVFSTTHGERPVNGWAKAKRRLDELSGVTGWIFHDLRRTARTRISAIPAEEHVRELLVAHGRRGIQAHYDQHKYRDEKRELLEAWGERLTQIVNPLPPPARSNVVPFGAAIAS
jgi:integrase